MKLKYSDIHVGDVLFYSWSSFNIITKKTKDEVGFDSIDIQLSMGSENVRISKNNFDAEMFEDRLLPHLMFFDELSVVSKNPEKDIVFFLFKLEVIHKS